MVHDLMKLVVPNPSFDQILWDRRRHVLSFRRAGIGDYINMWLNQGMDDGAEHHVERNGGPAADSVVLWTDGEWVDGSFVFTVPPAKFETP